MPIQRTRTFKIVTAHVSKATVDAATDIHLWTNQSDQGVNTWKAPYIAQSKIPERATFRVLNGASKRNGYLVGELFFNYLTIDMLEYWETNYFASDVESKDATFLWYPKGVAQYIQCHLHRPRQNNGTLQWAVAGWQNVIFRFTNGVDIT